MTFAFKVISKGIGIADLESVLFPDEGEVPSEFKDKVLEVGGDLFPENLFLI